MEETIEDIDSQKNVENDNSENVAENDNSPNEVENLKKENQSLYEQLKKAKGFVRDKDGNWVKKEEKPQEIKQPEKPKGDLSTKDIIALSGLHEDDVDEVIDYAKFKGITVKEAKNSEYIKVMLEKNAEKRKSAEMTATEETRVKTSKKSDAQLLADMEKGILPDDPDEMARAIKLRKNKKSY